MSFTINSLVYEDDSQRTPDSFRYTGPTNTYYSKDYIDLKRIPPKTSIENGGRAKVQGKMTQTLGSGAYALIPADLIISYDASVPSGIAEATLDAAIATFRALVASPEFVLHLQNGDVNH